MSNNPAPGSALTDWVAAQLDQPTTTEVMLWAFLIEAQRRMAEALDNPTLDGPLWRADIETAALSGMCAYLLDQLHQTDPDHASDVAGTLADWDADGEPCAEWVGEEIARRGVVLPPANEPAPDERHDLAALTTERHGGGA